MAGFTAFFSSQGKAVNLAEAGDKVNIVFTNPPVSADNVEVAVIEAPEGKEAKEERELVTIFGNFRDSLFNLEKFRIVSQGRSDPIRKPVFTVSFGGVDNTFDLPVDKDEGGLFDLRLDIKGRIAGKEVKDKNVALLHVAFKRDVVVIPIANGRVDKAFAFIRTFMPQWRALAPATRVIVEMAIDPKSLDLPLVKSDYDEFLRAISEAARLAHGGAVILCVGHGDDGTRAADGTLNTVAWTNLVPEDRKEDAEGRFFYRMNITEVDMTDGLPPAPPLKSRTPRNPIKLNALSELGDKLNAIVPKIEELRFHTCNVGGNATFCQLLADRIQIPVRSQKDFIKYEGFPGRPGMFCFYDGDDAKPRQESEKTELPMSKLTAFFRPGTPPPRFP
ncbi:MAG: hypothetical protein JWP91_3048 [Fibrobacteres bacterium]|nr:hypothetical protein [Fibrobacterota bacterium]